jgi:hypothetical protein
MSAYIVRSFGRSQFCEFSGRGSSLAICGPRKAANDEHDRLPLVQRW